MSQTLNSNFFKSKIDHWIFAAFLSILTPSKKTKLVLSFDGGGVRAIAAVVFLKQLEIASGKKIFDIFDFFIGTSAGGINALNIAGLEARLF